ncbi:hypothetical protein CCAX7_30270 [Capsulimonas corticalis]|uniref:Uncharacterized protein n=1 Tax=Capsulimonas corticalis TaxID=2219043 RepID=A0A402CSU5_9BACT|nr:PA14 domain-containing protein [Capsulimonas corticalis]BDI30976.1 hypothetical protein CCAX7_30270 [Capsulimonas corticalis]
MVVRLSSRMPACAAAGLWMLGLPLCAQAVDSPNAAAGAVPAPAASTGPTAPANVTAKPISATRLDVAWADKSDNEDNFEVEISSDGTNYTSAGRTADNTTDFACTGLKADTVYHVRVRATNSLGQSAYAVSPEVSTYSLGTGLMGHYFHRPGNGKPPKAMFNRVDPYISFEWTNGLQSDESGAEYNFMIVWTGQITPVYSETYTFYTESDDGSRLWVDGKQLVDDWVDQSATEKSGTIDLKAGQKYDIKVAYYANGVGSSSMKLSWSSASQAKEIVLPCQFDPKTAKETEAAASKIQAQKGLALLKPAAKKKAAAQ